MNLTKLSKSFFSSIKYSAKRRNIEFTISEKDILDRLNNQNGLCYFSGLPISLPETRKEFRSRVCNGSIDRIDSSRGYTKDNVQLVHKDLNFMKHSLNQEAFINYCTMVALNFGYNK